MTLTADFDRGLTADERALIARAAAFADAHLVSGTEAMGVSARRDLLRRASREGLAAMEVPAAYGGAGATFSTRMRVCEEMARHDAAFAFALVNHHNVASRIANSGSDAVRSSLLPDMLAGKHFGCTAMTEAQSGSDFVAMQTRAGRVNGGWVLTGGKAWIANAAFADVFLVYAQTDPAAGARGIGGFLVLSSDAGFERSPAYEAPATAAMEVGGFSLKDCFVPEERVLYAPPGGFMAAMRGVNQARIHVAALNAGMIAQSLKTALDYGESRQAFGQAILDHQGLRWSLATVQTQLTALQLMVYRAAAQADAGEDVQSLAAIAKKFANEQGVAAISHCMQAMGAAGLDAAYPFTRHLNCARAFCYTDGTPEMMNERIAHLMRKK